MIGPRIEFRAILTNSAPLHIGSGGTIESDAREDGEAAQIGDLMRAANGAPFIPGSSLKGVLRRAAADAQTLMGGANPEDLRKTIAGQMMIGSAFLIDPTPYQDTRGVSQNRLETKRTRVAIDGATGVAEKARLFSRLHVDPGAEFGLRIAVPAALAEDETQALSQILAALSDGVALGKSTRHGEGKVRIKPGSLNATTVGPKGSVDCSTDWASRVKNVESTNDMQLIRLRLKSDAPFLISDPENAPPKGDKDTAQVVGLKDKRENGPVLTGSTLLGALREKSAWVERMKSPSATTEKWDSHKNREEYADYMQFGSPSELTYTQRLFGITGWRGLLSVRDIALKNKPALKPVTSVRIDRFSAAPVDNALFTTEAWLAPEYEIALALEDRAYDARLRARDEEFLKDLICWLTDDVWGGLDLGFGKSRGFGHFSAEEIKDV